MRLLLCAALAVLALSAADQTDRKTEAKASSQKTAPAARPVPVTRIPEGAVETEPGTYRYTDAAGKKWLYRSTPFGIARWEDKPVSAAAKSEAAKDAAAIKATEDGDTIRFERPGPFGTYKWQRKKSELDETEQAAWDRARTRAAGKQE